MTLLYNDERGFTILQYSFMGVGVHNSIQIQLFKPYNCILCSVECISSWGSAGAIHC